MKKRFLIITPKLSSSNNLQCGIICSAKTPSPAPSTIYLQTHEKKQEIRASLFQTERDSVFYF